LKGKEEKKRGKSPIKGKKRKLSSIQITPRSMKIVRESENKWKRAA